MGLFGGDRERIRDLESRVRDLERGERARDVELKDYLERFTRLFKRTDQRARVIEQREDEQLAIPEEAELTEESTMDLRRRFGR